MERGPEIIIFGNRVKSYSDSTNKNRLGDQVSGCFVTSSVIMEKSGNLKNREHLYKLKLLENINFNDDRSSQENSTERLFLEIVRLGIPRKGTWRKQKQGFYEKHISAPNGP